MSNQNKARKAVKKAKLEASRAANAEHKANFKSGRVNPSSNLGEDVTASKK